MGVDYKTFKHLNPTRLKPFAKAFEIVSKNKLHDAEFHAYMTGIYVSKAIGCTFGKSKYPKEPLGIVGDSKKADSELTEEEIKAEREKLILSLQLMQTNFELSKEQESVP